MYVFDITYSTLFDKDVKFMGSPICFDDQCTFLSYSISRDILKLIEIYNRR